MDVRISGRMQGYEGEAGGDVVTSCGLGHPARGGAGGSSSVTEG